MEKQSIWVHLSRKFFGEITETSEKEIKEWLGTDKKNKTLYKYLEEVQNFRPENAQEHPEIYRKVQQRIRLFHQRSTRLSIYKRAISTAAIFILVVSLAFFAFHYFRATDTPELVLNEIKVPKGNRTSITLSDGTKVWIGNGSKLIYPSNFSKDKREVEILGEGYFEVKHDSNRPFVVCAGTEKIKVLGTKFSVHAYPEDRYLETSLIDGKIRFVTSRSIDGEREHDMVPGDQITYLIDENKIVSTKINTEITKYWFDGVYEFNDETLGSLASKIDRFYNLTLIFEDNVLREKSFTGTIRMDDNIFTFLEAIKRTSTVPLDYNLEGNNIYITNKTSMGNK